MNIEQKTQRKIRKTAAIGITDEGTIRLYDMVDGDVTCMPFNMPFTYPQYQWRLYCGGKDVGGFKTPEELAYFVLTAEKPDEIILIIGDAKYVARKVSD